MLHLTGPSIIPQTPKQLFVLLHGYGMTGESIFRKLAEPLKQTFPEGMVVAPNAPYPCKEYPNGFDWIRFDGDWTTENIVVKLRDAENFLNGFLDGLLEQYNLPDNKLALIGFSQGARLALHIALRRGRACGAVVSYSGGVSQPQLLAKELRSKPPICLIHGEKDDVLHVDQHYNAVKILKMLEVPVTERVLHELKHRIDKQGIEEGVGFLKQYIGS